MSNSKKIIDAEVKDFTEETSQVLAAPVPEPETEETVIKESVVTKVKQTIKEHGFVSGIGFGVVGTLGALVGYNALRSKNDVESEYEYTPKDEDVEETPESEDAE